MLGVLPVCVLDTSLLLLLLLLMVVVMARVVAVRVVRMMRVRMGVVRQVGGWRQVLGGRGWGARGGVIRAAVGGV